MWEEAVLQVPPGPILHGAMGILYSQADRFDLQTWQSFKGSRLVVLAEFVIVLDLHELLVTAAIFASSGER